MKWGASNKSTETIDEYDGIPHSSVRKSLLGMLSIAIA